MRDVSPLLIVALGALATARLTRLLTADQLTEPLRRQLMRRVQEGGHLEYLLACAWCSSVWIGSTIAALVIAITPELHLDRGIDYITLGLLALAYSQVAGTLASREVEV